MRGEKGMNVKSASEQEEEYCGSCQGYWARRAVTGRDVQRKLYARISCRQHLRNDSGSIVAADA